MSPAVLEERKEKLFELGEVVLDRSVLGRMVADPGFVDAVFQDLMRHEKGDWGDICDSDRIDNELSVDNGESIYSAYLDPAKVHPRLWIVTERKGRPKTTILFAGD